MHAAVETHSARYLPPGADDYLKIKEKCEYNRFILCHDTLSDHVEKLPAKVNKLYETTDLTDSFWQRHIVEEKYP